MADEAIEFEKQKWKEEKELRDREPTIKENELNAKIREQGILRILIPVAAAIVAAFLAGAANVFVAKETADRQDTLETLKADRQDKLERTKESDGHKLEQEKAEAAHKLEREKVEAARITEALKNADPDQASKNLQLLIDLGLIQDKAVADKIVEYRKKRPGGEGAGDISGQPPTEPKNPAQPESGQIKQDTVLYQSGWVGGGHNQNEMCQKGIAQMQPRFPGKTLTVVQSDEQNRKDFFGHVEYNYSCVFHVG